MAEGGDWEFPEAGDHDDEERNDDTDDRIPLLPREGDWTEGRGRPSSHKSPSRHQYVTGKGSTSSFANPSFVPDVDEGSRLLADKEKDHGVLEEIRREFPRFDPSKANFIFGEDNFGRVYVELKRKGGRDTFCMMIKEI